MVSVHHKAIKIIEKKGRKGKKRKEAELNGARAYFACASSTLAGYRKYSSLLIPIT